LEDDGRKERSLSDSLGYEFPKEPVLAGERFVERLHSGRIAIERVRGGDRELGLMSGAKEALSFRQFLASEESRIMRLVRNCSDTRGR
jgi:hypothetical protein